MHKAGHLPGKRQRNAQETMDAARRFEITRELSEKDKQTITINRFTHLFNI